MMLWQRLWLLFTVIWVVVAALNAFTIIAFGEGVEREKAVYPVVFGILVPAVAYGIAWTWFRLRKKFFGADPER